MARRSGALSSLAHPLSNRRNTTDRYISLGDVRTDKQAKKLGNLWVASKFRLINRRQFIPHTNLWPEENNKPKYRNTDRCAFCPLEAVGAWSAEDSVKTIAVGRSQRTLCEVSLAPILATASSSARHLIHLMSFVS